MHKGILVAISCLVSVLAATILFAFNLTTFPQHDYSKQFDAWSNRHSEIKHRLREITEKLANDIGARNQNLHPHALRRAERYIFETWSEAGLNPTLVPVISKYGATNNVEIRLPSKNSVGDYVIGAHFDSFNDSPGADDNASGVAMLMVLSEMLKQAELPISLRIVAFTNEEPPFFQTEEMGSYQYLQQLMRKKVPIRSALIFDTVGYYSLQPQTQYYPFPFDLFYNPVGDFIGFIGNFHSREFTGKLLTEFRARSTFPAGALAVPDSLFTTAESDQWAFWEEGIPGLLVTDTAYYRYPYYHSRGDIVERLDFDSLSRVTLGMYETIVRL